LLTYVDNLVNLTANLNTTAHRPRGYPTPPPAPTRYQPDQRFQADQAAQDYYRGHLSHYGNDSEDIELLTRILASSFNDDLEGRSKRMGVSDLLGEAFSFCCSLITQSQISSLTQGEAVVNDVIRKIEQSVGDDHATLVKVNKGIKHFDEELSQKMAIVKKELSSILTRVCGSGVKLTQACHRNHIAARIIVSGLSKWLTSILA